MIEVAAVGPMTSSEHPSSAVSFSTRGTGRSLSSYGDDALMARAQDGDREAYAFLVERYSEVVLAVATRFLGNPDAGRDVAQDVFLELWVSRLKYKPEGRFKSYLTTLVLNRCRDTTRRRGAEQRRRDGLAAQPLAPPTPDPAERAILDQSSSQLERALARLEPDDRELLVMRYAMELGYDEIAGQTGRPSGTLRSRVFHSLRKLRTLLEGVA
jgi:RNA polymerase sigma-70 factor (ECF subfamily)